MAQLKLTELITFTATNKWCSKIYSDQGVYFVVYFKKKSGLVVTNVFDNDAITHQI